MKNKTFKMRPISLALLLAGIGMASVSNAADLVAIEGQWSPDGGITQISMWGFASDTGQACNSLPAWNVGPQLSDADLVTGDLTINLRNCLSEGVSIVIPGQPATFTPVRVGNRVTAFTHEAAPGGTASYTWTGAKAGTYLYQSGSHPAKQVQMGLYGALTLSNGSYPGTSGDVTLLYSEIDPTLHDPVPKAATPLGYHPRHYLVNGEENPPVALGAGDTNQPTVLRFLNAGLDYHVPALNDGYMSLVAEDGNAYPFAKTQYSVNLAAGKTIDALWQPGSAGDHVIYDRRGNGLVASMTASQGTGAPVANGDSYSVQEDGTLTVATIGVLANDTDALLAPLTVPPATASLTSSTSSGSVSLNANGSFSYTPNADFNGSDSFTYKANDGTLDSDITSVDITVTPVNDVPVADAGGPYAAFENVSITLDGSGSSDADVDTLTYAWDFGDLSSGTGIMPSHTYVAAGTYTVNLVVNDGAVDSAMASTTVEVVAGVNTAPVPVNDIATVDRGSANNFIDVINLTGIDFDVDNNLRNGAGDVTMDRITVTTGTTTSRGGTVTVVDNGVLYTPRTPNWRGTDTFRYKITDLAGAESNISGKVKINVVIPTTP